LGFEAEAEPVGRLGVGGFALAEGLALFGKADEDAGSAGGEAVDGGGEFLEGRGGLAEEENDDGFSGELGFGLEVAEDGPVGELAETIVEELCTV